MVMRPDVVDAAIAAALADDRGPVVYLSPRGRPLTQAVAHELAARPTLTLLCGRYEGVDERVLEARQVEEISLGDFVLSGGEPAAIALIDAVVRLLPGVVGAPATLEEESFERGLLEYPHYTRPAEWQGRGVPEVLLSGHHEKIRTWRLAQAEAITRSRRPDLWARYRAEPNTSEGRRPCNPRWRRSAAVSRDRASRPRSRHARTRNIEHALCRSVSRGSPDDRYHRRHSRSTPLAGHPVITLAMEKALFRAVSRRKRRQTAVSCRPWLTFANRLFPHESTIASGSRKLALA